MDANDPNIYVKILFPTTSMNIAKVKWVFLNFNVKLGSKKYTLKKY